jgi:hypothetical protein
MGTEKKRIKMNKKVFWLTSIYFLILSVLTFYFLYRGQIIYRGTDIQFHANRIEEIFHNLKNGNWLPMISTYSANQVGIATNIYYPALFLYPFALLRFLALSPITVVYLGIMLFNFLTFIISFYTFKDFDGSWKKAFIFANIYFFSAYRFLDILNRFDISEFIALTFIPLVFWAFYKITFRNEYTGWIWLAVAMASIVYAHILTGLIVVVTMLTLVITNFKKINNISLVLIAYCKSVVVFLGLTVGFIYSFLHSYLMINVKMPKEFLFKDTATQLDKFINNSLANNISGNLTTFNMGIVSLGILIVGGIIFNKLSTLYKKIYLISLLTTLLTTTLIPWSLVQNTPLSLLQFPFRLFVIAGFFIALVGTEIVSRFKFRYATLVCILGLYVLNVSLVQNFVSARSDFPTLKKQFKPNASTHDRFNIKVDRASYFNLIKVNPNRDYVPVNPKKTDESNYRTNLKIYDHRLMINGHWTEQKLKTNSIPNGVIYNVKAKDNMRIALPFYVYNKENYKVYVNGKVSKWKVNDMNTVSLNINSDSQVRIQYSLTSLQKIAITVSILSFLLVILILLVKLIL